MLYKVDHISNDLYKKKLQVFWSEARRTKISAWQSARCAFLKRTISNRSLIWPIWNNETIDNICRITLIIRKSVCVLFFRYGKHFFARSARVKGDRSDIKAAKCWEHSKCEIFTTDVYHTRTSRYNDWKDHLWNNRLYILLNMCVCSCVCILVF